MSKVSESLVSEVTIDMKSGLRINMDINVTLKFKMSKIASTTFTLTEAGTESIINLFELNYGDQIFVMKEVARMIRAYENELDSVAFGQQVFKTQKSLRY